MAVQFSRDMPNWQLFETEYLQPIQKMLSLPVAGLHFSEMVVDRVRERLLQLPGLRGFESVALFLDILNDLATAGVCPRGGEIRPPGPLRKTGRGNLNPLSRSK